MSELQDIIDFYESLGDKKSALATVVATVGPSYRSPGARSIVSDDSNFRGGLSAGCLEGDVGCRLDGESTPFIVEYDLASEDEIRGFPFGCGGTLTVFVEPLWQGDLNGTDKYPALLSKQNTNNRALNTVRWLNTLAEPAALITVIKGAKAEWLGQRWGRTASGVGMDSDLDDKEHDLFLVEEIDELCQQTLRSKASNLFQLETQEGLITVFAEYFEPAVSMRIFGDSEDARALENMATVIGMKVERVTKTELRKLLEADSNSTSTLARTGLHNVVMTHDLHLDTAIVKQLLISESTSPSSYIGILGPQSRTEKLLRAASLEPRLIFAKENFFAPIGLDLGAETPNEIALSILSEIQTVAKGRRPAHLRNLSGPIHERVRIKDRVARGN